MPLFVTFIRLPLLALLLTALAGCATSVVSAHRSAALVGNVPASALVVIANPMGPNNAAPSIGTIFGYAGAMPLGTSGERITADAQAMGGEVVKQLPAALQASGLVLSSPPVLTTSYPAGPKELADLLPGDAKDPVLVIKPISAKMECPGACFAFLVAARLFAADRRTELWTATLQMPPKASKFSDFSGPVGTFVETLVAQMKKDGLVR